MSWQPPGHMPGVHIPGTLTPIGAVVALQQRQAQFAAEAFEQAQQAAFHKRRSAARLLLLFNG